MALTIYVIIILIMAMVYILMRRNRKQLTCTIEDIEHFFGRVKPIEGTPPRGNALLEEIYNYYGKEDVMAELDTTVNQPWDRIMGIVEEALRFYADKKTYQKRLVKIEDSLVDRDSGALARGLLNSGPVEDLGMEETKAVLEFYGNPDTYKKSFVPFGLPEATPAEEDKGARARKALEAIVEMELLDMRR